MSSPIVTAGESGDDLADALRGVLKGLALSVAARGTCETCGCLLRPLEVCPSCFPRVWRERADVRRRWRQRPGGIRVLVAPDGEHRDAPRNFARTA